MSIDKPRIASRIRDIERHLPIIERIHKQGIKSYCENYEDYLLSQRCLEIVFQSMIDISSHIISSESKETPQSYADLFEILGKQAILPRDFSNKLKPMAGLRNLLVHNYAVLESERLFEILEETVDDAKAFIQHIQKYFAHLASHASNRE